MMKNLLNLKNNVLQSQLSKELMDNGKALVFTGLNAKNPLNSEDIPVVLQLCLCS